MIALHRAFSKLDGASALLSLLRSQGHPSPIASHFSFQNKKDNPLLQLTIQELSLVAYHKNQLEFSNQLYQLINKLDKKSFKDKEKQLSDISKLKGFESNLNTLYLYTRLYCRNRQDNNLDLALLQLFRNLPLAQIQRKKKNQPLFKQLRWLLSKFQNFIADNYLLQDQTKKQVKSKNPLDFVDEPPKEKKPVKQALILDKNKQLSREDIDRLILLARLKVHTLRSLFICQQHYNYNDEIQSRSLLLKALNQMNSTNSGICASAVQILQTSPPQDLFEEAVKFIWRCGDFNQLSQQTLLRLATLKSKWVITAISILKEQKIQFEQTNPSTCSDLTNFITKVLKVKGFQWTVVKLRVHGKVCVYLKEHDYLIMPIHYDEICRISGNILPEIRLLYENVLKSRKASFIREDRVDQCQNYIKKKSLLIGCLGDIGKLSKQKKSVYEMDQKGGMD